MTLEERNRLQTYCQRDVNYLTASELDDYTELLRQYLSELHDFSQEVFS